MEPALPADRSLERASASAPTAIRKTAKARSGKLMRELT
jgi:hypothetical protein